MGWQTVTILILGMVASAETVVVIGLWRTGIKLADQLVKAEDLAKHKELQAFEMQLTIDRLSLENTDLNVKLSKIPLTPKPKPVDDGVIRARNSADVRRLTEQSFGGKPDGSVQ